LPLTGAGCFRRSAEKFWFMFGLMIKDIMSGYLECKACFSRNYCTLRISHSMATAGRSVEHRRAVARRHIEAYKNQQDLAQWGGQAQQADN
jgi:hypothetical protein